MVYITHKNDDFGDGLWHWVDPTLGCRYFLKSKAVNLCWGWTWAPMLWGNSQHQTGFSLCFGKSWEADVCPSMWYRKIFPPKAHLVCERLRCIIQLLQYRAGLELHFECGIHPMHPNAINQLQKSKDDHFYECGKKLKPNMFCLSMGDYHPKWDGNIYILYHYIIIYIYIFIYKT